MKTVPILGRASLYRPLLGVPSEKGTPFKQRLPRKAIIGSIALPLTPAKRHSLSWFSSFHISLRSIISELSSLLNYVLPPIQHKQWPLRFSRPLASSNLLHKTTLAGAMEVAQCIARSPPLVCH